MKKELRDEESGWVAVLREDTGKMANMRSVMTVHSVWKTTGE